MEPLFFSLRFVVGAVLLLVPGILTVALHEARDRDANGPRRSGVGRAGVSRSEVGRSGVSGSEIDEHHAAPMRAEQMLIALAWGAGIVPTLAFFISLFTPLHVSFALVAAVALAHTALSAGLLARKVGWQGVRLALDPRQACGALNGPSRAVLGASVAIGLLYFLKYDRSLAFNESCIYTTALTATGHVNPELRLLVENIQDARLGNTGVLAGFIGVFGQIGFRVLYGVCGTLLALGGANLGWICTGKRSFTWMALLLLPLNPAVAGIPLLDENLLTLSFAVPGLALLLRKPRWFAAGALIALAVTMRHVMILAIPATILIALARRDRIYALTRYLGAFFLFTLPENMHHLMAPSIGSLLRFESSPQYPSFPYEIFGINLHWNGLLNWPFHSFIVRTPGNPFPTFVRWPLWLADHLGLVLFSLMVIGFFTAWTNGRGRLLALFWLLWWGPVQASLAVQEAWDVPNKMGVIVVVFASFVAWILYGAIWVQRRPLHGMVTVFVLVVIGLGACAAIQDWRPPVDERYYTVYPGERRELPMRIEDKAKRLTDVGLLPDIRQLNRFGTFLSARKISELWQDLSNTRVEAERRAWGWFPSETPPPGAPVVVELDMREPLYGRTDFLKLMPAGTEPDIDLVATPQMARLDGLRVAWEGKPIMLYTTRSNDISLLQLFFLDPSDLKIERPFADPDGIEQCKLFSLLAGMDGECDEPIELTTEPRAVLRVRLPSGALSVATTVNRSAQKVLLWKAVVSPTALHVNEAIEPWHN